MIITQKDTIQALKDNINEVILDIHKTRLLAAKFAYKGLDLYILYNLLDDKITVQELMIQHHYEYMGIVIYLYELTKDKRLNPKEVFSDMDMIGFESFTKTTESIDRIKLSNVKKIDDYNYIGYMTLKEIHDYHANSLIVYNKQSQRASKIKTMNDTIIREVSVNKESVVEISNLMQSGSYEEDMIILNVRLTERAIPKLSLTQKFEDIYDLEISPDYDIHSETYTVVEVVEGWHRVTSAVKAYSESKNPEQLKGGLPVKIVLRDLRGARRIVEQTFKRSDTDKDWLKALSYNDYTDFVDRVINATKSLKDEVADTYDLGVAFKKLTYKTILVDIAKYMKVEVENKVAVVFKSNAVASNLEYIISYAKSSYAMNDDDVFKKFCSMYTIAIFFIIAIKCKSEDWNTIMEETDHVCMETTEFKAIKELSGRNVSVRTLFKYIKGEV